MQHTCDVRELKPSLDPKHTLRCQKDEESSARPIGLKSIRSSSSFCCQAFTGAPCK